jgi:hypothetical protein
MLPFIADIGGLRNAVPDAMAGLDRAGMIQFVNTEAELFLFMTPTA